MSKISHAEVMRVCNATRARVSTYSPEKRRELLESAMRIIYGAKQMNVIHIPLDDGKLATIPLTMSVEDFELLIQTLNLWKRKLIKPEPAPTEPPLAPT